jgi:hypothetical protein
VALVAGSAENRPPEEDPLELWRFGHSALLPGDGIAHNDHTAHTVSDEDKTVAAIEQSAIFSGLVASKGEALRRDAVRRVQDGGEHDLLLAVLEDAE